MYKGWKTTALGLAITAAAVASIFIVESITWLDASIGIGIGLALVFTPDTLINKLYSLFKK